MSMQRLSGPKRFLALPIVAVLVAGGSSASAYDESRPATQPRVVFLMEQRSGCADDFQRLLCNGFVRATRRTGVSGRVVNPTAREDLRDVLSLLARQPYDLVITFGYGFPEALSEVAPRYPDARFALVDRSSKEVTAFGLAWPRNAQAVVFRTSEAAYLAGWLAARLEQARSGRDVIGVVGGIPIPAVTDFVIGFRAGARRVSPDIRVLTGYSGDFLDRSKCEAIARRQVARGAGVLFNVAGVCGLGTLDVARKAGVWGVGVDTDQSFLGPHILTSVVKHFEAGFEKLLREVKAGRIRTGGDTVLTLREGAVGLGTISPKVPESVRREIRRLEGRIASGEIRVPGAFPDPR
jgi:basic membrane protein A